MYQGYTLIAPALAAVQRIIVVIVVMIALAAAFAGCLVWLAAFLVSVILLPEMWPAFGIWAMISGCNLLFARWSASRFGTGDFAEQAVSFGLLHLAAACALWFVLFAV